MQCNCVSVVLSAAGFNTQACCALAPLAELPLTFNRRPVRATGETGTVPFCFFFFLIAAYFPRFQFGFPSTGMEVDGQDPIGAARPFLHPLPGVVGWEQWVLPASLPHHAYKAHLLVSLFALAS